MVLHWPVRIDISGWYDLQSTLVIIILIHRIHILFLILNLIGVIIIRPSLLVPPQLILTQKSLIFNIVITASAGVTSKVRCLCTRLS
jgi:hypothetical protein